MKLFKEFKHTALATATALTLAVVALGSVNAQAAIVEQPAQTKKQVSSVGTTITVSGTNLKINGKKYTKSKIKKKIKTVQTAKNPQAYKNYAAPYGSNAAAYGDDEELLKAAQENFKYIGSGTYELTFLKKGKYKVSYDTYNTVITTERSADKKYYIVTENLEKTHHVDTYKVLANGEVVKSVSLGKSSKTYTSTWKNYKYTTKTVVKNKFLKGTSGKLKIKTANKNYAITNGFAVTSTVNGTLAVAPVTNKGTVAYSTGKALRTVTYKKYVLDANGKETYAQLVVDGVPQTNSDGTPVPDYSKPIYTTVKGASYTTKNKETTVYYGYTNKYTGASTSYTVAPKTVYTAVYDEYGVKQYQKDANGDYVYDANKNRIPVVNTVAATSIIRTSKVFDCINGVWGVYDQVDELVVLPEDTTFGANGSDYYTEATLDNHYTSEEWNLVSLAGIPANTGAYYRATKDIIGTWVPYTDARPQGYTDTSYDVDANGNITARYAFIPTYYVTVDEEGETVRRTMPYPKLNEVVLGESVGKETFFAK